MNERSLNTIMKKMMMMMMMMATTMVMIVEQGFRVPQSLAVLFFSFSAAVSPAGLFLFRVFWFFSLAYSAVLALLMHCFLASESRFWF